MIASLVKGRRKYSSTLCINVNEILEKHTEILKTNKLGENKLSGTIALQKEMKIPSSYFHKKETETQNPDESKTVNEKIIADMRYKIENLKKQKQVQSILIKLQKKETYQKCQTIEQYEKENSNYK